MRKVIKKVNDNWKNLKTSKDGMPTYDSFYPYILKVLEDGKEKNKATIIKEVAIFLRVPEEIINIKYPNYPTSQGVFFSRLSFTLSDLYKAAAIERPRRAVYRITEKGLNLLATYGDGLTKDILKEQKEFKKYEAELKTRNEKDQIPESIETEEEPVDERLQIEELVKKVNNEVATELLDKIRSTNPYFFEKLVLDLLEKMGYGGTSGSSMVTNKSNDGGIDGIINQDPLGTNTVYVQAKRYKESNIIQRPAIQGFYGALAGINADRGVFITTSSFSKNAIAYAKRQSIVLVDGIQLTDMMLKYKVGIESHRVIELLKIDDDYFEDEELY